MGHDLADLYRDRMTIRQLWVRVQVLAQDSDSPLWVALSEAQARAFVAQKSADLDDVHTRYLK